MNQIKLDRFWRGRQFPDDPDNPTAGSNPHEADLGNRTPEDNSGAASKKGGKPETDAITEDASNHDEASRNKNPSPRSNPEKPLACNDGDFRLEAESDCKSSTSETKPDDRTPGANSSQKERGKRAPGQKTLDKNNDLNPDGIKSHPSTNNDLPEITDVSHKNPSPSTPNTSAVGLKTLTSLSPTKTSGDHKHDQMDSDKLRAESSPVSKPARHLSDIIKEADENDAPVKPRRETTPSQEQGKEQKTEISSNGNLPAEDKKSAPVRANANQPSPDRAQGEHRSNPTKEIDENNGRRDEPSVAATTSPDSQTGKKADPSSQDDPNTNLAAELYPPKQDKFLQQSSDDSRQPPQAWEAAQNAESAIRIQKSGSNSTAAVPTELTLRDHLSAKTTRDFAFSAAVAAGRADDRPESLTPPAALLRLEDPFAGQGQDPGLAQSLNSKLEGPARAAPRSAFELTPEQHTLRRMQMTFARIVSKLAEDFAGPPTAGDDEWDIDALISRSMDRRPLQSCRFSRERESLIVVMDVSGSCRNHAEFFQRVSALATSHQDVELMSGNNGRIEAWWHASTSTWQQVTCGRWPFRRRTILFFGDHDGEAIVTDASHRNRITWFSNETRPGRSEYKPSHFTGWYVPCGDDADLVRVARRLR